jgi:TatD DNase family protein
MWDCHCHLADSSWTPESLEWECEQARQSGVHGWFSCAYDVGSWSRQQELSQRGGLHIAQGLHPWCAEAETELGRLLPYLEKAQALGEVGLDFFRARTPEDRDRQLRVLRLQLEWARQLDLPVVLHCVRAHKELMLEVKGLRVCVHGFLGSLEEARRWLELGAVLSLGPHARGREDLMRFLPLDRVLLESDAPSRGARLLDVVSVWRAWRGHQPLQEEHIEANLVRFLGLRR